MLSALSRGYGTWNGELDVYGEAPEKTALPDVEHERHKHGVTITPRTQGRGFPYSSQPHPKDDGCLELPKTYLTRKGALLLFSAPDAPPEKDHMRPRLPRKRKQQELIDLSLKLGTLERLSLSVLQYGDQGFDRENSSISDKENRWFLKFMRQMNTPDTVLEEGGDPLTDRRAQPGADLKVYLQDLKQRASSRCYGRESSLSSRARSQELRDILQQLEDAWPSGLSQPLSQAPTSFTDGSHFGPEEFFYPRSPSLSSESSRAFSGRAKVLSSHKLTASLKSLNYLGRPQSTEPGDQARSVTSPELVIPHGHLSHTRRSKSGYWSGTADIPDLRKRPQSSYHGSRQPFSTERQTVASADGMAPLEESVPVIKEEAADERSSSGSRAISVQVSTPLGYPMDGSEHVLMSRVIQKEAEMDRASVSSSLQQEDDILLPLDVDEGGVGGREEDWPEGTKEAVLGPDGADSLAKPLQPQYSGVLQDTEMLQDYEEDKLRKSEQGSRRGSQAGSVASLKMRDVYRPSSVMSSRAASRADMLPEEGEEEVDQEGLDELMAEGTAQGQETSEQKMDAYLLDHVAKQLEKQEKYASSFSGSVDRPEPDPETLISLQGGGTVISSSSVKSESDGQTDVLQRLSATPEPKTAPSAPTPEPKLVSPTPTSEPKELSPTPTPEPKSATVTPAANEVQKKVETESEEVKPEIEEVKPVVAKAEQVMDSVSIKTEGEKDVKSSSDLDNMAMAMAEAGFQAVPPPRPPSRSASPAPSSSIPPPDITVEVSTSKQEPASVSEPVTAPPKEVKPAPEKVEKLATKTPHPPSKKPGAARQKSPSKGGKVDIKGKNNKTFVKAMDISSVQPDQAETEVSATPALKAKESPKKKKEPYRPPPPPPRVKTPAEKPSLIIPEHMKEALVRRDSISKNELENELMRMHKVMDESLGVSSLITEDSEGLTEEELQQAQQALKERMEEAQRRMNEAVLPDSEKEKPEPTPKKQPEAKPKKGKKVRVTDPKAEEERVQKEAAKEQRRLERQKRLEEAKALQEKILQKEQQRKAKESEADHKARELEEQVELMRAEEDAIQQAEEDAREQLAALRKAAREEREARRKQELEKKKQYAQARRDKEKQMMEEARKKEQEMLERIADSEMRRAIREEEERKRDEEERLAQERYEEELREAQQQAEEEELRLQELERQAEEEAFQRIIAEREEAERQREELELQARRMAEEIEHARKEMLEEEQQLEEERRRQEAEEEKRREEEKQRLLELQRLEEEARLKMREGIDQRREWALKRREVNIDRKKHLDGLRQTQGITEPWTYSYFIVWPRESYCRPMGVSIQEQNKGKKGPKKK